jgi:hypothetical protein
MISAIHAPDGPLISCSFIPNIAAQTAIATSVATCPIGPCPTVTTRAASNKSRCVWSPRTDCPTKAPVGISGATIAFSFRLPPSKTGSRRRGKKKYAVLTTEYLPEALADFSGYLAIDEVYDGPHCILSVVDNRRFHRVAFRVLESVPTQAEVRAFLQELKAHLEQRGLVVRGITTDGSDLYPKVLQELWPDVPHQQCIFHILREINKAVLHAVAQLRKALQAQIPKAARGRPKKQDQAKNRQRKRLQQRVADLFEHRHLFVRHHLSAGQKKRLQKLTRGLPHLRVLRELMDEVYRLFDRRCKTATALARLAKLRQRVRRHKRLSRVLAKLNSPNMEKALLFLDDKLLGATSNAVERSNRRFRKAQQSIYSVRTKPHLEERLALDLYRDLHALKRRQTLKTLHLARSDPNLRHRRC